MASDINCRILKCILIESGSWLQATKMNSVLGKNGKINFKDIEHPRIKGRLNNSSWEVGRNQASFRDEKEHNLVQS